MIRRSNQGGQKGKRQGAPTGNGRKSSAPRTSDAGRRSAPRGSDGGRHSAPRQEGFGKTSDKAHSKPFGKSGDKPFSKGGDRPFKKSGDRDFSHSDRKPFGKSEGRPYSGGSDRPFKKAGERDHSSSDRKPYERSSERSGRGGSERPARKTGDRDFDRSARKPYEKTHERPAKSGGRDHSHSDRPSRGGSDRPSRGGERDYSDRKPFDRSNDRKPFDRSSERPNRGGSDRSSKGGDRDFSDRKPFDKSGDRPYKAGGDKPFKKSADRDFAERKPFVAKDERPRKKADEDFDDDFDYVAPDKYKITPDVEALAWDYTPEGKHVSYVDYSDADDDDSFDDDASDDDDDNEYAGRAIVLPSEGKVKNPKFDAKQITKATSRPYKPAELKSLEGLNEKPKTKNPAKRKINDGTTRLNKLIAQAGVCSRREADTLIATGVIEVNGQIVTELGYRVGHTDRVSMSGQSLVSQNKVYILLNKPKDYITTSNDPQNRRTVFELIKDATRERVFSVGRLDRSTTGVLLFTNDGEVAERLTHPSFNKKKIYQVELHKALTGNDFHQILEGVTLEDGFISPDALSYVDASDKSQIGIEIHSGRNRIVRRIFEHLGYNVLRLDRVYYAGLTKKNLPRGKWRYLNEKEIAVLKQGAFE